MSDKESLPLIVLRDLVIFPNVIVPILIGRKKSVAAAQYSIKNSSNVLFVLQKDALVEDPTEEDLYFTGVKGKIVQFANTEENSMRLLVESVEKVEVSNIVDHEGFLKADYVTIDCVLEQKKLKEYKNKISELLLMFSTYLQLRKALNTDDANALKHADPILVLDIICGNVIGKSEEKQKILEERDFDKKIEMTSKYLKKCLPDMQVEKEVEEKVKLHIEKAHKEFYIRERINALQKELEKSTGGSDTHVIEEKMNSLQMPDDVKKIVVQELEKYKNMNYISAEASIIRNYLETLVSLPWGKIEKKEIDINNAENLLNSDHYGLEEVKDNILEYIAAMKKTTSVPNSILLLVGPSGVGKTSLVKTIAKSLGRQYVKCALGGLHDESEIRGHRRTYVGAMPGKIIAALQKAKTDNPVILLDEIDKMGANFRGDPASAFLEVLDYGQNNHFLDNYLGVEYDLSKVLFICTANTLNIPKPLLDRMSIVRVSGYTPEEKLNIALQHLLPKQLTLHNVLGKEFSITEDALKNVIQFYTKEAGVRELDRKISTIIRKFLRSALSKKNDVPKELLSEHVEYVLGPKQYTTNHKLDKLESGSIFGLAYTEYGGELLTIESVLVPGKGVLKSTGKLGDVMKESTEAAYSYFRSIASSLQISKDKYTEFDLHIHFPEGATPKDGPSAGMAIFFTILSLMTDKKANANVAMTGEITLKGNVLAIGGLKEKLLAAYSNNIKTVLIPESNMHYLAKIPEYIKNSLEIIPVKKAYDVIDVVFS